MTRFAHRDGSIVHLAYCTNMHPAEDLDGILRQLDTYAANVRKTLGWDSLGVGLWLPAPLATLLASDCTAIVDSLESNQLEVVTLNGFPYQAFQTDVVKLDVYEPNWTTQARLDYTVDLARILHQLLPADAAMGSISTLPLGWRTADLTGAPEMLGQLADRLAQLADTHGRPVRVAIEPEPGCEIETTERAIEWIAGFGSEWIGLCLDMCHLAVQFEDPESIVAMARDAGVQIVKAQVSNALRVPDPTDIEWLQDFHEPRFLHQARQLQNGHIAGVDDLNQAAQRTLSGDSEWRVHYHVPLHHGNERTTQPEMQKTLHALVGGSNARTTHLELETYTWSVLPEASRPKTEADLVAGIVNEFEWVTNNLEAAGLERIK